LGLWQLESDQQQSPLYPRLYNFEVDLSPVFPQSVSNINQTDDLSSYTMVDNDSIELAYDIDTWDPENNGISSIYRRWRQYYLPARDYGLGL
jgi:hypothetical protein